MQKNCLSKTWAVAVACLLLLLFIWRLPLNTQDGPNHKRVALILERLPDSPPESKVYRSGLGPLQTNSLFPLLYLPLSRILGIDAYEKIFFGFFLILLVISYRFFLGVWDPGREELWVWCLPMLFHPLFISGMYNFLAGVPLTLLALTLMKKWLLRRSLLAALAFWLLCWAAFLAHPFTMVILGLCWFVLCLQNWRAGYSFPILFGIPLGIFWTAGFILPFFQSLGTSHPLPPMFPRLPELLANFLVGHFVGFSLFHYLALVPLILLFILTVTYSLFRAPWNQKIFWIVLAAAYLLSPAAWGAGGYLHDRFLIFIWLFLPLGLPLTLPRLRIFQATTLVSLLWICFAIHRGMGAVEAQIADAKVVLAGLPQISRLYSINFQTRGPAISYYSLMHLWANVPQDRIVFSPFLFAHTYLMPLNRIRPASPTYFPAARENLPESIANGKLCAGLDVVETTPCSELERIAWHSVLEPARYYDYWFTYQPPHDLESQLAKIPGLKLVARRNHASLWKNEHALDFNPSFNF